LGFGVASPKAINALVEKYRISLLTSDVIYHLLEQLKVINSLSHDFFRISLICQEHVEKLLPAVEEEEILGEAEVLEMFKLTGARKAHVAGCKVTHGYLMKDKIFKIIRNGKIIFQGSEIYFI